MAAGRWAGSAPDIDDRAVLAAAAGGLQLQERVLLALRVRARLQRCDVEHRGRLVLRCTLRRLLLLANASGRLHWLRLARAPAGFLARRLRRLRRRHPAERRAHAGRCGGRVDGWPFTYVSRTRQARQRCSTELNQCAGAVSLVRSADVSQAGAGVALRLPATIATGAADAVSTTAVTAANWRRAPPRAPARGRQAPRHRAASSAQPLRERYFTTSTLI